MPKSARLLILVALVPVLLWFLLLTFFHRDLETDEYPHMNAIRHFAEGNWSLPPDLPMLPGYHVLMSLPSRFLGVHGTLVRFGSVLLTALLLIAQAVVLQRLGKPARNILLLATLPVLFPFTALAYTEVAGLAFLMASFAFQLRGRFVLTWIGLLAACLVRQSNVLWMAFFAFWGARGKWRLRQTAGHAVILIAAIVFFAVRGRLSVGPVEEHAFRVNPAHVASAGIWLWILLAPVLVLEARRVASLAMKPLPYALILLSSAFLTWFYKNPHPFNQDDFYLRNRILLFLDSGIYQAFFGSLVAVIAFVLAWTRFRRDPEKNFLATLLPASFVFILFHPPVDPRYYIVPMALLHTLASYDTRETMRLVLWQGVLCVGICAGILTGSWML